MTYINHIHSIIRWLIIIVMLYELYKSYVGYKQNKRFALADNKLNITMVSLLDIQIIIGLVQYLYGAFGIKNIQNIGFSNVMKDSTARFFAVEHILGMLLAFAIVHIGRAKMKKISSDLLKHKKIFWTTLIALLIILLCIPWPITNAGVGRHWFF